MKNKARLLIDKLTEAQAKSLANGLLCLLSGVPIDAFIIAWQFASTEESTAEADKKFAMDFFTNECSKLPQPLSR